VPFCRLVVTALGPELDDALLAPERLARATVRGVLN